MLFNATIISNVSTAAGSTEESILFVMKHVLLPGTKRAEEFSSRGFPSLTGRRSAAVSGKAFGMSAALPHYQPAHTHANHVLCPTTRGYCDEGGSIKRTSGSRTKKVHRYTWPDNDFEEDQDNLRPQTDRCRGQASLRMCASEHPTPLRKK